MGGMSVNTGERVRIHIMLQCVAVCCSVLQCVAVCCSVLQCVAVRARILQRLVHAYCGDSSDLVRCYIIDTYVYMYVYM